MSENPPTAVPQPHLRPSATLPKFVINAEGELYGEDTEENRELVRRVHACVNACEGISTEELEQGVVQDMRRVISEVIPVLQQHSETDSSHSTQPLTVRPDSDTHRRAV